MISFYPQVLGPPGKKGMRVSPLISTARNLDETLTKKSEGWAIYCLNHISLVKGWRGEVGKLATTLPC